MRKIILGLMLLSTIALQAQITSRIMLGLGGGLSSGVSDGRLENFVYPMGSFDIGYAVYKTTNYNKYLKLGFRTGLSMSYSQIGMKAQIKESFTRVDYYGHQLDYTVTGSAKYEQKQFNLEIPLMFALESKGFIFGIGTKLIASSWNHYNQTISDPMIAAFYGDYGVTVVNDIATGLLSDDQISMSGKATMPSLMFSVSAEIGYTWKLKNNHSLGFNCFVDYVPGGVGGSKDTDHNIIEIGDIKNDCFQPVAPVTVNPLVSCDNFKYKYVNAGVRFIWTFDIEHKKHAAADTESKSE